MKKLSVNTIINIVAAVLLLASLIVVEVSFKTAQGWFDTNDNILIIVLSIIGMVLLMSIAVLNITGIGADSKAISILKTFFSASACACAGVIFGLVMGAIATEFAFTFFSDFNDGTPKEHFMPAACMQAVTGMVLSIVVIFTASVANVFDERKG